MSVFMLLQVEGDPGRLAEVMQNRARWEAVNERAAEAGVTAEPRVQIWHTVDTPDQF